VCVACACQLREQRGNVSRAASPYGQGFITFTACLFEKRRSHCAAAISCSNTRSFQSSCCFICSACCSSSHATFVCCRFQHCCSPSPHSAASRVYTTAPSLHCSCQASVPCCLRHADRARWSLDLPRVHHQECAWRCCVLHVLDALRRYNVEVPSPLLPP
jgi:hypothetical protein